jgi:hypothetical protein
MMLALWIVTGLLAAVGLAIVAWPVGPKGTLAPAPSRPSRAHGVVRRSSGRSRGGVS